MIWIEEMSDITPLGEINDDNVDDQTVSSGSLAFLKCRYLDVKKGIKLVGGSENTYYKVLAATLQDQESTIADVRNSLAEGNTVAALRIVHSLKGVSGTIAAKQLQENLVKLELQLKELEAQSVIKISTELEYQLNATQTSLENVLTDIVDILHYEKKQDKSNVAPVNVDSAGVSADAHKILAVDDTRQNLEVIKWVLASEYLILEAVDGESALSRAKKNLPDLILLDVIMPGIDGYEVCRQLKLNVSTRDIPVIFLTSKSDEADQAEGFAVGAVDYITKPISPTILKARVKNHLRLSEYSHSLENMVAKRTNQLSQIQDASMLAMAALAEQRDSDTGNHIRRTQEYVRLLAERLSMLPKYSDELTQDVITLIYKAAPLHDIGKVSIPDNILNKPGKLTEQEFNLMKGHAAAGKEVIDVVEAQLDEKQPFLQYAREIAWCHHEKWDGSGYPRGLSGEEIPLSARLMAVADVYDALVSKRCYKPSFSFDKALSIIYEGKGSHFDPVVVDTLSELLSEFKSVAEKYHDNQQAAPVVMSPKALIVEDDPTLQLVISGLVNSLGMEVDIVDSGEKAITKSMSNDYHLILMDMFMPGMNGDEATKAIRDNGIISIIAAVTGNVDVATKDAFMASGADYVLTKPIDKQKLATIVKKISVK